MDISTSQRHDKIRKLQVNIPYEYGHQNSQQNAIKQNPKRIMHHDPVGFITLF